LRLPNLRSPPTAARARRLSAGNADISGPTQPVAPVDLKTIRRLCATDLRTYCAEVRPGGGRLMQCARTHEVELSADCRAVLETVEEYRKARAH
jgi:hypothetical protein